MSLPRMVRAKSPMSDTISMSSNMSTLARNKKVERIKEIFRHCAKVAFDNSSECELEFAITLAAYMMQIELGDFEPGAFKSTSTSMDRYVPNRMVHLKTNSKSVRKQVLAEYGSIAGTNKPQAMLRFARICKASPTFGITFTRAQYRQVSKTNMEPALVGFDDKHIVIIDPKTKALLQKWDITKVIKWQGSASGLSIKFGDYTIESIYFAAAGEAAVELTQRATNAIQQMLSNKKKSTNNKAAIKMQSSTDDTADVVKQNDEYGGFEEDEPGFVEQTHRLSVQSLHKQSGFLSGINMTTNIGPTKWFDMNTGNMSTMSRQSSEPENIAADAKTNEWDLFLEDSSEDLTASAELLDTVARLGPKKTSPKWCAKKLKETRVEVRQQVLGIAAKCKNVLSTAQSFVKTKSTSDADRKQLKDAIIVFTSTLPLLGTNFVNAAALCTLPAKSEEILETAGDLWIGLLQFVQAIHEKEYAELMEGVNLISKTSAKILELIKVLTKEDQQLMDTLAAQKQQAYHNERQELMQKQEEAREAEAQALEAIRNVEQFARDEQARKRKLEEKREADAHEENKREALAEKKAKENAEKFAKAEAKRLAKEQQENEERLQKEEKKRLKEEEQERKRRAKEEKERLEREAEADKKRQSAAKFSQLLGAFEQTAPSPVHERTSAVLRGLPKADAAEKHQKTLYRASIASMVSDEYDL
eukprot:m.48799 g.48799  ORF g.48799 m.48799 type:complete len:702 (-) comp20859_c0_seq1:510-2615(-)